jgi:sec-independent protein translocase protein TatB
MPDILFILLLALVIFGPKKLPEVMRTVAKYLAQFRMMSEDVKRQINNEIMKIDLEERQKKIAEDRSTPPAPLEAAPAPAPAENHSLPPSPVA